MARERLVPMTLMTGVTGEMVAEEALNHRGWATVEPPGTLSHAKDLRVRHNVSGRLLDVSVKSTSTGFISFPHAGASLRAWVDRAAAAGAIPVVVMVELHEPAAARRQRGGFVVTDPPTTLTAMLAEDFADRVDGARREYAAARYLRGPKRGELKTEAGLLKPLACAAGQSLAAFVVPFEQSPAQTGTTGGSARGQVDVTYPWFFAYCRACGTTREIVAARGPAHAAPPRHCEIGHHVPGVYGFRKTLPGEGADFALEG
jgi:hypothetical protein